MNKNRNCGVIVDFPMDEKCRGALVLKKAGFRVFPRPIALGDANRPAPQGQLQKPQLGHIEINAGPFGTWDYELGVAGAFENKTGARQGREVFIQVEAGFCYKIRFDCGISFDFRLTRIFRCATGGEQDYRTGQDQGYDAFLIDSWHCIKASFHGIRRWAPSR